MPRFRPRISILNALLLMTIVAMAIVIVQLWREIGPMRRQLQELRVEVGSLDVDDDSQIHAVSVKEAGSFRWNWRIWLPKGRDYWIHASHSVPEKGVNNPNFTTFIGMGGKEGKQVSLHVQLVLNENGKRTIYVKCPAADCPMFEVDDAKWVKGDMMISEYVAGEKSQVSSNVDEPIVLLRLAEYPGDTQPPAGLLVWISDQKNR